MDPMMEDDSLFPPLPNDLDDLFSEDLLQFLGILEGTTTAASNNSADTASSACQGIPLWPVQQHVLASHITQIPKAASSGPRGGVDPVVCARLVTTQLPSATPSDLPPSVCPEQHQQAYSLPLAAAQLAPQLSPAGSQDLGSSGASVDTAEDATDCANTDSGAPKVNKRKAPEVDWRSIEDPAERRRQRRLAKNRVTAARSRERKKVQWGDMEARMQALQAENSQLKAMLEKMARENHSLKDQIALFTRGTSVPPPPPLYQLNRSSVEPAVLVLIATLLLICCFLPGDKVVLLGSAVPLLLMAEMVLKCESCQSTFDALVKLLVSSQVLLQKSSTRLKRSIHRLLFKRHYYIGRKGLAAVRQWAITSQRVKIETIGLFGSTGIS